MNYKDELVQCFFDSVNISEHILEIETENAIQSNKVYKENFIAEKRIMRNEKLLSDVFDYIIVESNTSFNAAKKYLQYGKTAVLNFANPHNPGGGVGNGAMAQEECLCRSSNLYLCISNKNVFNDYYLYHQDMNHFFFSDRLIYTKGVTVFKDDSDIPVIMPKNKWFNVDVITCSAPYIAKRRYTNKTVLKELFKIRIKNIFEAAIDNDVEVLILGAFGCGAFKNPPEVVAKAFHEVIDENNYKDYFKKIVFAIKSNNLSNSNYDAFYKEFYGEYMTTLLENPPLPLIEPLRSRCDKSNDYMNYQSWKISNKYYGKQFSVLGDSISTLAWYNPKDYNVFYYGESCEKSGVKEMKDTWWGKVIDFFGGELLVNNSWSGSRVTRLPNNDSLFPSGCSDERTSNLHINSVVPDVIIIYLGTNDWAFGAELDGTRLLSNELNMQCFSVAYETMLSKIKTNYPNADIWCCTLSTTFMSSYPSFKFPYNYGGTHIEEYNQIIKNTANQYKCKVIDLYSYHIPYDSIDGSHPNVDGMNTLATMIIRSTGGKQIEQFMDCENNQHDFFAAKRYSEATKYICKKCGKVDFNSKYFDEFYDLEPPSKCSKCQGEFELSTQTGDYDYYVCKNCGNHICVSPFSILIKSVKFDICPKCKQQTLKHSIGSDYCTNCNYDSLVVKEELYDQDAEYVRLPSYKNRILFGDTLKLYDIDVNKDIEIQKVKIDVGRSPDCELLIDNKYISQIHASFYYEYCCWFIMDKGSRNGTRLNGKKLENNIKYELYSGDIISFSTIKDYVFYNLKYISVGTVINGKYELLSIISKDEMMEDYFAIDKRLNIQRVVKVFHNDCHNVSDVTKKFILQEAEMMKSFDHPALPRVVDIISTPEYLVIVMDYTKGETLKKIVEEHGAQSIENVIDWAKQLCDVLDYIHSLYQPHIYQYMQPANVILQPDGNIKIIDFSIMRICSRGTPDCACLLEIIGYGAPEQFGEEDLTDARTDIFGLGMTLYHLITGIDPKKSPYEIKPICQVNPDLPKGLEYIIDKCIQHDPKNRYQSCKELMNDLTRYQELPPKKKLFSKIFGKK